MEELLKIKLVAASELKNFTNKIMRLSLKTEYNTVNSMIEERQYHIEKINRINEEINRAAECGVSLEETGKAKDLKKEIREIFNEIYEMDNIIRKNINNELKSVKSNLNKPEEPVRLVNIKA